MRSDCPISYALDFFGDKWTLLIIRDMVFDGKRFYKDFQNSKEGIATNILSDRLKKLEQNGFITSEVYPELRTKKQYTLTEKGLDAIPILAEIMVWSTKYEDGLAVPESFIDDLKNNRESVLEAIREKF